MATEKTIEPTTPLDWPTIISDIEKGITIPKLAQMVGCTKETIYALKRREGDGATTEPRHALGARILSVHKRELAKQARNATKRTTA